MKLCAHTMGMPGRDIRESLALAAEIGCAGIEVRCAPDGQFDPQRADERAAARALEVAERLGVAFACLTPYYRNFVQPVLRESEIHGLCLTAQLAAWLRCPYVRAYGGILPPREMTWAETWERTVTGLREAADRAGELGVGLVIETHGGTLTQTATQAAALARDVDRANVGILFDYVWVYAAAQEPLAEAVRLCAPFIRHVHVKDCIVDPETRRADPRVLGQGEIDVRGLVAALQAAGYTGYLSDEYEKYWHPELPEPEIGMRHNAQYLRECLASG